MVTINDPLTLPCGAVLPNRLCKSAMTEGLADSKAQATKAHVNLYRAWAESETGLLITGNIPVDRRYVEKPGNVCIDGEQTEEALDKLRAFAKAATSNGNHCWVQLTHAGRQSSQLVAQIAQAPGSISSTAVLPPVAKARMMTIEEIESLQERFANAASVCKKVGFTGVQVHSAHGYLFSSFLSPMANNRTDKYGGSLENRASALLQVLRKIRAAVGPEFPVSVKLNSSDFQAKGFSHEDAIQVARWIDQAGLVDLLEVSGGNYESPAMMVGKHAKESTVKREAYFLDYAEDLLKEIKQTPVLVTGGFRTRNGMQQALSAGIHMIGIARPFCVDPRCTKPLLAGEIEELPKAETDVKAPPFFLWLAKTFKALNILKVAPVQIALCDNLIEFGQQENPQAIPLSQVNVWASLWRVQKWDTMKGFRLEGVPKLPPQDQKVVDAQKFRARVVAVCLLLFFLYRKLR